MKTEMAVAVDKRMNAQTRGTCAECRHCKLASGGDMQAQFTCRRNPPRVFAFPMQTPQGIQWVMASVWPNVARTDSCGSFEPELNS